MSECMYQDSTPTITQMKRTTNEQKLFIKRSQKDAKQRIKERNKYVDADRAG